MFISLSKTLARFGGIRLGVGMRMSKKNTPYLIIFASLMMLFKMMWYMMIVTFWLLYVALYGVFIFYKWLFKCFVLALKKVKPYCNEMFEKLKMSIKKEGNQA